MSAPMPPCDHDECPPTRCLKTVVAPALSPGETLESASGSDALLLRCIRITEEADKEASKTSDRGKQLEIVTEALRRVSALLDECLAQPNDGDQAAGTG